MAQLLGSAKIISGFDPRSIGSCQLWLDAADTGTMNSTPTVTTWNDKSGNGNNMTGTATWSGSNMTFNGTNQAFSNTGFVFPSNAYSMFAVYSNTTAPASGAYMNAVYGNGGYPMLGTFDTTKAVTARSVVGNVGGLGQTATATANGWAAQIASTGYDVGTGVATDSSGNVFVTGYYAADCTLYNTGGTTGATLGFAGGTYDVFLAKYSSAGSVLWAARIAGTTTSIDQGNGVATDSSGNVFVTGAYYAAATLYNTGGTTGATLTNTGPSYDAFLAKYSSAGSVLWAAQISGTTTSADIGRAVATDSSGNVFVTGWYGAALTLYNTGGGTGATLAFTGGNDCFLAKYSSAGSVVWAARITGTTTSTDLGYAVATDSSGNVFVTGYYSAALTLYNSDTTTGATLAFTGGGSDCFLAKYSSAGSVVWAAQIAGTGNDRGYGVATDSSGNVFVTGYYGAALTLTNTGGGTGATLAFAGVYDAFLAKYSSAGSVVWATRIGNTTVNYGQGVATDSSGNVFVTGYYGAALTLYNTGGGTGATLPFAGLNYDAFLAKYSSAGSVLWATQIAGTGEDYGYGVATDSSGNVFVTGYYTSNLTLYNSDTTTGATLAMAGVNDAFLAKYSSTGFMTGTYNVYSGGYPASSNILVDGTYAPSSFSPYVNGSNVTALSGTVAAATGLFIGGPSNYFNGSLSELVIYAATLTTSQRQALEGYLTWKWGTKSSLPAIHPFYSVPAMSRGFQPTDLPGCTLWMDAADNSTMNSTTTVTTWNDKSGLSNTMTGTATWSGSNMTFNGSTQAFSNTGYVFPSNAYSIFAVYSNTTAPASAAYMNVVYGNGGYPMLGTFDTTKAVTVRSVVGNAGGLGQTATAIPNGWAAQITGTGTSADRGYGVATDSSGNVFVTGYYGATCTLTNTGGGTGAILTYTGGVGVDAFLAKYSSAGSVVWATRIASTSDDLGYGVATDSSGNVFVTGYYSAACTLYNTGGGTGATLAFTGGSDCFLAKYSSAGSVVWATRIAGTDTDIGYGVATDSSGNVFVTGQYYAALTLYNTGGGTGATLAFTGGSDAFLAKYSSAGSVLWATRITGTGTSFDGARGVATDSSGNVFVTGSYGAACTLYNTGGGTGATLAFTGGDDCFLAKYSSAGSVVWATRITGSTATSEIGYAVATDSSGNVFVTGYYSEALTLYNTGGGTGATLGFIGGVDVFLAKYSSAGSVLWAAQITGTSTSSDIGYGVATDSSGNVFVTGYYGASALTLYNTGGGTGATLATAGANDAFLAKYSSAGSVVWAAQIASTSGDAGYAVATDSSGNVFVTGFYGAALTLYDTGGSTSTTLAFTGGSDCFLAKYSSAGFITGVASTTYSGGYPASSNVLVDGTYAPSSFSPYVNGSNVTARTGTTAAATGLYIGGPSNYFNGSLSELLIYASTLTSSQRQQVEGYLTSKWKLSSQIISTHPFKTLPPSTSQPPQFQEVTPGNWTYDWQPYLKGLVAANSGATAVFSSNAVSGLETTANASWCMNLAPNGLIYTFPTQSSFIGIINPTTSVYTSNAISTGLGGGAYIYIGGGGLHPNGNIYIPPGGNPANNANVGIFTPSGSSGTFTTIASTSNAVTDAFDGGGVLAPNGMIYFVPQGGTYIGRIDTVGTFTSNSVSGTVPAGNKYSGAALAPNGLIYCIPGGVLLNVGVINPTTNTYSSNYVTMTNTVVNYAYFAGVLAPNGKIYCIPNNSTTVGIIDPVANTHTAGPALSSATNAVGPGYGNGAYFGGCLGPDGNIYCAPYVANNVLVINPTTNTLSYLSTGFTSPVYHGILMAPNGTLYMKPAGNGPAGSSNVATISFTGLKQLPSLNWCLSPYANRSL